MTQTESSPFAGVDTGKPVSLGTNVDVFPNLPLPEFNTAGGQAFAGKLRDDGRSSLVVIVCTAALPLRTQYINPLRTVDNPCIPRLRESGIVAWPATNSHHFALAYDRPIAPRLWQSLAETHTPMGEDILNRTFLTPLVSALMELQRIGLTHGGLRPTQIFWREGTNAPPQLGETLSSPAGLNQPVLFEPIERALSVPMGRGPGSPLDDSYALGITLAMMLLGQNPTQGMDDAAIIQMKMERGSFNMMVGSHRLGGAHIELLRGLLTDDSRQRWTASDIHEWLSGRRLTPKNAEGGKRANRGFPFLGKDYWQPKTLSAALATNPGEAARLIENNALMRWVTRSLDDQRRVNMLNEAIDGLKANGAKAANYEDQLVTRCCIALDPQAPLRYRGLTAMPDGIPCLLADAMATGGSTQIISEIIAYQLVTFWVNAQQEGKTDLVPMAQQLERVRANLGKSKMGGGLERALYELNPTLPCLSPMLRGQAVLAPKNLLSALERVASSGNRPGEPIDRHIAAFLVVHDRRGEQLFDQMSPPNGPQKRGLALLTLYGELQYRFGPDSLPALSQWLATFIEPSIRRFLNKPYQEKMRRQLKEVAAKGQLTRLLNMVDDPDKLEKDEREFLMARQIYRDVQREIDQLTADLSKRDELTARVGRPVAATVASFLSIILLSIILIKTFFDFLR